MGRPGRRLVNAALISLGAATGATSLLEACSSDSGQGTPSGDMAADAGPDVIISVADAYGIPGETGVFFADQYSPDVMHAPDVMHSPDVISAADAYGAIYFDQHSPDVISAVDAYGISPEDVHAPDVISAADAYGIALDTGTRDALEEGDAADATTGEEADGGLDE